jgi:hypothetical protein
MQTTAKTVKGNIQSLLAKANKETGKEHTNLSDAFEDLILGYGVDQTEVFDGNIELEGEFEPGEPKITDYYKDGYDEGYSKGLEAGGGDGGYEAGKAEVYAEIEPINAQLENTLNGTDTGGKSFYDLVYQDITITQDCTNALQLAEIFNAVVGEDEEMAMFINQNWTSYPDSSTPNNTILNAMIYSSKYRDEESILRSGYFMRWRDGLAGAVVSLTDAYDTNVKAGDVFRKVVLRWKNI